MKSVCFALAGVVLAVNVRAAERIVHAKDYGWNPTNATEAVQKAVDSGADVVVIDAMPSPWYVGIVKWRGNLTVRLEKGTRIHTDPAQWEKTKHHAIFNITEGIENFTLEGAGMEESLVGSFPTHEERMKYCKPGQEQQDGVRINRNTTNIVVRSLRLANCGCDGLCIGGWRTSSYNVLVEDVDMVDNHRQGCSPTVADKCVFRRCRFRDTNGTEPAAGVDVEPCYDVHPLRGLVFEDCEFGGNNGGGLITPLSSIYPSDITVRRCTFHPEKGRCPIDILARGDTYVNQSHPAEVTLTFEDCTVETYANDPAIEFATGPIFTCSFKNLTIREVDGWSIWRPVRKCAPIEVLLNRDYHGAFPPSKSGKVTFENVKVTGFKGRPLIQFVDTLGKQDVIGYFSGIVDYNGEKIDTATFNYKAPDITEPPSRRIAV